jgi:hypothetical protein
MRLPVALKTAPATAAAGPATASALLCWGIHSVEAPGLVPTAKTTHKDLMPPASAWGFFYLRHLRC